MKKDKSCSRVSISVWHMLMPHCFGMKTVINHNLGKYPEYNERSVAIGKEISLTLQQGCPNFLQRGPDLVR